jgi:hypothetical protein
LLFHRQASSCEHLQAIAAMQSHSTSSTTFQSK